MRTHLANVAQPLETLDRSMPGASDAAPDTAAARRVLLVDDDAVGRQRAKRTLVQQGYAVTGAASVESALEHLARGGFCAVVSETCLPDGTGFDIFHAARELDPQISVVFLGSDPTLPATLSTPGGAVRYRCKALGPDALVAALQDSLASQSSSAA